MPTDSKTRLLARIAARGENTTVPDNDGAADAAIDYGGHCVGGVTLLPDPGNRGRLSIWGDLAMWADDATQAFIDAMEAEGHERDAVIDTIVAAVRKADCAPT